MPRSALRSAALGADATPACLPTVPPAASDPPMRRPRPVSGTVGTVAAVRYEAGALVLVRGGGRFGCGQLASARGGEFCWTI